MLRKRPGTGAPARRGRRPGRRARSPSVLTRWRDSLGGAAAALLLLVVAGATSLPAQTPRFFHATDPLAEHEHAPVVRPLAALLVSSLNRAVETSIRIELTSDECGEPGARRGVEAGPDGERVGRVVLCSGLVEGLLDDLGRAGLPPPRRDSALVAGVLYLYAHELGHLMSEVAGHRLPPPEAAGAGEDSEQTRPEETAADQFVALALRSRPRLVDFAAAYWGPVVREAEQRETGLLDLGPLTRRDDEATDFGTGLRPEAPRNRVAARYRDRHGIDASRLEHVRCWVRGSEWSSARGPAGGRTVPGGDGTVDSLPAAGGDSGGAGAADPAAECGRAYRRVWDRWDPIFFAPVDFPQVFTTATGDTRTRDERPGASADPPDREPRNEARPEPSDGPVPPDEAGGDLPELADPEAATVRSERFWKPFDFRVGDYAALILPHFLRAQGGDLPESERTTARYRPDVGSLDLEIRGSARSRPEARELVREYWDFLRKRFRPYVEDRLGPRIEREDVRILYYDTSGTEPELVAALVRGRELPER